MPASVTVVVLGAAAATGIALSVGSGGQTGGAQQATSGRANCAVTVANGSTPPGENPTPDVHGNGKLWTGLNRDGRFVVAPESAPEYLGPGGEIAVDGVLLPDGSVGIKAPWWRGPGARGRVRVRARRLDAHAPRVDRTVPPSGYGLTGFQAMGLGLPTTGCWKITGSVANASLTFVTLVERAR
jgi:hypothetical protein